MPPINKAVAEFSSRAVMLTLMWVNIWGAKGTDHAFEATRPTKGARKAQ